jgi:hypothetical protein
MSYFDDYISNLIISIHNVIDGKSKGHYYQNMISNLPMARGMDVGCFRGFFRIRIGKIWLGLRTFALIMNVTKYCGLLGIYDDNVIICSTHCLFMIFGYL